MLAELHDIEGMAALEIERQNRDQQQNAACQRIQEELDGGVQPVRSAPHSDEKIHRDQHRFPEHIEQDEIQCREDADHGGFHNEQHGHEAADPRFDRAPGDRDTERHEHGRHQDERQADPVQPQMVMNGRGRDPDHILGKLHLARRGVEQPPEGKRDQQISDRDP